MRTMRLKNAGIIPKIAILQIGRQVDSTLYIRKKQQACQNIGILLEHHHEAEESPMTKDGVGMQKLENLITSLNRDRSCHAILIQLPLPPTFQHLVHVIHPEKDVDGLTFWNAGQLVKKCGNPFFVPCTTKAILNLLHLASIYEKFPDFDLQSASFDTIPFQDISLMTFLKNRHITILGRSDIVGMPTFLSLLKLNATVRLCHSHSIDTRDAIQEADILIVAIGKPQWLNPQWIKPNAIVIDVGIHHLQTAFIMHRKIVGDVDQSDFKTLSALNALTPVPGGVGPMTVAMLLDNILLAAEKAASP